MRLARAAALGPAADPPITTIRFEGIACSFDQNSLIDTGRKKTDKSFFQPPHCPGSTPMKFFTKGVGGIAPKNK
jgi:hypothetical protein